MPIEVGEEAKLEVIGAGCLKFFERNALGEIRIKESVIELISNTFSLDWSRIERVCSEDMQFVALKTAQEGRIMIRNLVVCHAILSITNDGALEPVRNCCGLVFSGLNLFERIKKGETKTYNIGDYPIKASKSGASVPTTTFKINLPNIVQGKIVPLKPEERVKFRIVITNCEIMCEPTGELRPEILIFIDSLFGKELRREDWKEVIEGIYHAERQSEKIKGSGFFIRFIISLS